MKQYNIDNIYVEELLYKFVRVVNKTLEKSRQKGGPGKELDYEVVVWGKTIRSQGLLEQYHLLLPRITRVSMVYVVSHPTLISECLTDRVPLGADFSCTETELFLVNAYPSPNLNCGFCGHREYDALNDHTQDAKNFPSHLKVKNENNNCGFCNDVKDYYKRFNLYHK